jgi:FkbM family methyltransferase
MDIGAFGGEDARFYLAKGFDVVSVEANKEFADKAISLNREAFEQGRYRVLNAAIAEQAGEVEFFVHRHGDWSSVKKNPRFRPKQFTTIRVPALTADEVFRKYKTPYYVKIDIEGMEPAVIEAICRLKQKPNYVSFELGPASVGCAGHLHNAGYTRFKLVPQADVPKMKLPKPAREGLPIDFTFTHVNSGPFGEETPGPWLSLRELEGKLPQLDYSAGYSVWWDVHAARP